MLSRPLVGLLATLLVVLSGCVDPQDDLTAAGATVRLLVTHDMGTRIHLDETVTIQDDTTVMDVLRSAAQVETAHEGEFVVAIDGKRSGHPERPTDWFYHLNARLAGSGATHQDVDHGDVVVWDHRPWNHTMTLPLILTGMNEWPAMQNPILDPDGLAQHTDHPHVFMHVDGDRLVVLDAWARPATTIDAPWLAVHAIDDDSAPGLLVAASGEDAHTMIDRLDAEAPRGLGLVFTPENTRNIPAAH